MAASCGRGATGGGAAAAAAPAAAALAAARRRQPARRRQRPGPPCGRGGWTRPQNRRAMTSCAAAGRGRWGRPGALRGSGLGGRVGGGGWGRWQRSQVAASQASQRQRRRRRQQNVTRTGAQVRLEQRLSQEQEARSRPHRCACRSPVFTPGSRPAHVCFWPTLFSPLASSDTTLRLPRPLPSRAAAPAS